MPHIRCWRGTLRNRDGGESALIAAPRELEARGSLARMESAAERVVPFLPPVPCLMQLDWAAPLEGDVQIRVAGKKSGFGQRNEGVVADLGKQ